MSEVSFAFECDKPIVHICKLKSRPFRCFDTTLKGCCRLAVGLNTNSGKINIDMHTRTEIRCANTFICVANRSKAVPHGRQPVSGILCRNKHLGNYQYCRDLKGGRC